MSRRRSPLRTSTGLWLAGFVVLYGAVTVSLAARRHLWFDELFTYYIARQPRIDDVLDVLRSGIEPLPPLFYLLTRGSIDLLGDGSVAIRLPGLLGVLLASLCLFFVVARRSTPLHGTIAMFLPLVTSAYSFAPEARPYGLVLGCAAASYLLWQLRCDGVGGGWVVVGLAATLSLATANHYYAVFLVVPLLLGEAIRSRQRRRLDLPVVGAVAASLVPLVVAAPYIRAARELSSTFWAKPDVASGVEFFGWLLRTPAVPPQRVSTGEAAAFGVVAVGLAAYVLLASPVASARSPRDRGVLLLGAVGALAAAGAALSQRDLTTVAWVGLLVAAACAARVVPRRGLGAATVPSHEAIAAAAYALLPLLAVLVASIATGAYVHRYALSAVLAPAILLPLALARLNLSSRVIWGVVLVTIGYFGMSVVDRWDAISGDRRDERTLTALVRRAHGESGLPVAISHPHAALELSRYAPRAVADLTFHLAGPAPARELVGSDSTERALLSLDPLAPLRVEPFGPYLAANRPFVVLWTPYFRNWLLPALTRDGRPVRRLWSEAGWTLYRVDPMP